MKKIAIVVGLVLGLAACGDHDEAYYMKHLNKAQDMVKNCEKRLDNARKKGGEKGVALVENDQACIAAQKALDQAALDQEMEHFSEIEARLEREHGEKNWQEVLSVYDAMACNEATTAHEKVECNAFNKLVKNAKIEGKKVLFEENLDNLYRHEHQFCGKNPTESTLCQLWKDVRDEKSYEMLMPLSLMELQAIHPQFCAESHAATADCDIWKRVWKEKNNLAVEQYKQDRALFISGYNRCVDRMAKIEGNSGLTATEKRNAKRKIRETTPCSQIEAAFIEKGMGSSTNFGKHIGE